MSRRRFETLRLIGEQVKDRTTPASEMIFLANDRCDQENLIAQLKSGVRAFTRPVDKLVSNWASMVMASLAWSYGVLCCCPRGAGGPSSTGSRSGRWCG